MIRNISSFILKIAGWKVDQAVKPENRCILIGAPHTTNWDFPLTLLALSCMDIRFNWVAKHSLFRWPLGPIFRVIGGVPVDRSSGTGFLKAMIRLFKERKHFVLAIAPEGTRAKTKYWKGGFYTLACKAGVPVVLGYVDYPKKTIGLGQKIVMSGDIEQDFAAIQTFYQDKVGKYPEKQGEVRIKAKG